MKRSYTSAQSSKSNSKASSMKLEELAATQPLRDAISFFNLKEDLNNEELVGMFNEPKLLRATLEETFEQMEAIVAELGIDTVRVPSKLEFILLPSGAIFEKVPHPTKKGLFISAKPYNLMGMSHVEGLVTIDDLLNASEDVFTKNAQQVAFGAGFRTSLYNPVKAGTASATNLLGARKVKQIILQNGFIAKQPMGFWNWNIHPLFEGFNNVKLDGETRAKYEALIDFVQNGLLVLNEAYKNAQNELYGHLPRAEKPPFINPRFTDFPSLGEGKNRMSICAHTGYEMVIFNENDGMEGLDETVFEDAYEALFSARPARPESNRYPNAGKARDYGYGDSSSPKVSTSKTAKKASFSKDSITVKPKKGKPASVKTAKVSKTEEQPVVDATIVAPADAPSVDVN